MRSEAHGFLMFEPLSSGASSFLLRLVPNDTSPRQGTINCWGTTHVSWHRPATDFPSSFHDKSMYASCYMDLIHMY